VLAYGLVATALTTLLVGLVGGRGEPRQNLQGALHDRRAASPSSSGHSFRKSLLVAQLAISFVLLVAGGLFLRSLKQAEHANFGFEPGRVLNLQMNVEQLGYSPSLGRAFFGEVERRVRNLAGVEQAAFAFTVPMGYVRLSSRVDVEGRPANPGERIIAGKNVVGPNYFVTMGIPIERGRSFTEADDERSHPVAIVNRRLADLLWPGQDPLGRRFSQAGANGPWLEVVGLTQTGKYRFLFEDPEPYYYVPTAQAYTPMRVLHVRTTASPETLVPAIEREIHRIQPELPVYDVQTLKDALDGGYGLFTVRTGALFAAILAFIGLSLAVIGLYGVVSYMANERMHEFGIRIALGANRKAIAMTVIRSGVILMLSGTTIGLAGAWALTRLFSRLLFRVPPVDVVSFAVAFLCVALVTLLAMSIPAHRATRVDPVVALRSE
jgi:predicted permease